jgi:hypothetical protein
MTVLRIVRRFGIRFRTNSGVVEKGSSRVRGEEIGAGVYGHGFKFRIGIAFRPCFIAVEKGRHDILRKVDGGITEGSPGTTKRANNEEEQLLWREIDLGHVTDCRAEREEINPEAFIRQQIGAEMPDVLGVSAVDLVTLAEIGQVANKLTFRLNVPDQNRIRKHSSFQSSCDFRA